MSSFKSKKERLESTLASVKNLADLEEMAGFFAESSGGQLWFFLKRTRRLLSGCLRRWGSSRDAVDVQIPDDLAKRISTVIYDYLREKANEQL